MSSEKRPEEDKSFKVSDRRVFGEGKKGKEPEAKPQEETAEESRQEKAESTPDASGKEAQAKKEARKLPPIDFSTFILSLASSVLVHLGEVPDPLTRNKVTDLTQAKQTLDILTVLEEKTKGNLTIEEEKLFSSLLAEMRMRYLKAIEYIS